MALTELPAERNLDGYGAPLIPWTRVRERLDRGLTQAPGTGGPDRHTAWLATVRPDGRPHVMPPGILWVERTRSDPRDRRPLCDLSPGFHNSKLPGQPQVWSLGLPLARFGGSSVF